MLLEAGMLTKSQPRTRRLRYHPVGLRTSACVDWFDKQSLPCFCFETTEITRVGDGLVEGWSGSPRVPRVRGSVLLAGAGDGSAVLGGGWHGSSPPRLLSRCATGCRRMHLEQISVAHCLWLDVQSFFAWCWGWPPSIVTRTRPCDGQTHDQAASIPF
jgi:hypothetical protein